MRISVNNKILEVSGQRPLVEELREIGIDVPTMCYAKDMAHQPSCMVCMVKDTKTERIIPSCSTMPYEGMQIETDSDEIHQLRRMSLELLLSDHKIRCGTCDGKQKCKLRELALQMGAKWVRYGKISSKVPDEQIQVTEHLYFEPAKCIKCGLCVYNTQNGFTFIHRGFDMRVVLPEQNKKNVSDWIAEHCPTGALVLKLLLPLIVLLSSCRSLPETSSLNAELPDHPELLWEHRSQVRTVAPPQYYDGLILSCDKHGLMHGLNENTGEEQLSLHLGADMEAPFTVVDSVLYVGMVDGRIRCLSLIKGKELWEYETEGQIASKPVLGTMNMHERLFVGSYDNYMYILSPDEGKLIHRTETGYYINGSAAIWQNYAIFGGCDAWIRMVNGITGETADSLLLDAYIPASPVVEGNTVYVADYRGNIYELLLSENKIISHRKLRISSDEDEGMLSMPVISSNSLFLLSSSRQLICINRKDGSEKWHVSLKGDVGECTPVLVENKLLVCTKTGVVTIHDAIDGHQLWEYETGEQIISQPLVGESRFYVQTAQGTLLCFGDTNN